MHNALQSEFFKHAFPLGQAPQLEPPQSTSVSAPFFIPSVQDGGAGARGGAGGGFGGGKFGGGCERGAFGGGWGGGEGDLNFWATAPT